MIGSSVISMNFILFLVIVFVLVLVLELVLDYGDTIPIFVLDELIEIYSVLRADLLDKLIDESMGTDCDILLLCLLGPYFPSYNQVSAILSMKL